MNKIFIYESSNLLSAAFTSTPHFTRDHKSKPLDVLRTKNCYQLSLMLIS